MIQHTSTLFPARITRTSFFVRGIFLLIGALIASATLSSADHAPIVAEIILVGGGISLFVLLFFVLFRSILMPRIRDMGLHPAWSLLILVHSFNFLFLIALLFIPTDAFEKRSYTTYRYGSRRS